MTPTVYTPEAICRKVYNYYLVKLRRKLIMNIGDRLRPLGKTSYKANFDNFTIFFELNHQQLWCISSIKDGICNLSNSSCTMSITIKEVDLPKIFETNQVTRGRYSSRWDQELTKHTYDMSNWDKKWFSIDDYKLKIKY